MVNDMKNKYLIPFLAAAVLSGCATTSNDPARARAIAGIEQARADGSLPLTEAAYVYPNWVKSDKAP